MHPTPPAAPQARTAAPAVRTRPLDETPALAARAMEFLNTPRALVHLNEDDTRCIVGYMRQVTYSRGTQLFRDGDDTSTNHMLLVLEGEVAVDIGEPGTAASTTISVLGPGSFVGEMALLDGSARSATCTAVSDLQAAGLSRRGLERLIAEHPTVAARLLAGVGQRMAERLRALNEQMQMLSGVNATLQAELARLRA